MRKKFSELNVDFSSSSLDPLGSRSLIAPYTMTSNLGRAYAYSFKIRDSLNYRLNSRR